MGEHFNPRVVVQFETVPLPIHGKYEFDTLIAATLRILVINKASLA